VRFDRIRLENFKCFDDADLRLGDGVTVIHGLNGSGKSSLLESAFFALYGARAIEKTLDDVVTIGAESASVELWFTHDGASYHVERRLSVRDDRAVTTKCVLETPEGTVDGARNVRQRVAALLRMDAEAFVNCAYVRQGEVNKLINATPSERQTMIDELLQLGKLEDYRERASDARVGIGRVRDGKEGELANVESQIDELEAKNLHARLNDLETELGEVTDDIERFEANRRQAERTRDEAESVLEEYREKRTQLQDVESDIEDLRAKITETESERDDLQATIEETKAEREDRRTERDDLLAATELEEATETAVAERIETLRERKDDLAERLQELSERAAQQRQQADNLDEQADDFAERAAEKRERASDLEADVAEREDDLADRRERLATIDQEIESLRAEFDDVPVAFGEAADHLADLREERQTVQSDLNDCTATLEATRERVAAAERLLDEGKCPECGQSVDGSPQVDSLEADRAAVERLEDERADLRERRADLDEEVERAERLREVETEVANRKENRRNLSELLDDREVSIEADRKRVGERRERADELDAEAGEKREAAEEKRQVAAELRAEIGECNREQGEIKDDVDRLEALADALDAIADADDRIETLRERRATLADRNDERREYLATKRERRDELREAVDEATVEQARDEKDRAETYLEEVETKLSELHDRESDLRDRIGAVKNEIETLESLREERDALAATVDRLDSLYEEAEQLQEMYGRLRSQLRQRNVETLQRMLNDTFELIYQNDSYSRIELSGDYELTVYQKDGEPLDPEQLSGGERALFNLSLRSAIYRLLAEGIEGAAPMPPLILDEPTVFLDSGHVSKLADLVTEMRGLGVEQILVVSHDDELVDSADDLVQVRKDATTNRSTVERSPRLEIEV
jgi:exonuclease SbcC